MKDVAARLAGKNLAGAFARYPHLPKMLKPAVVRETVLQGVERGLLAARLERPDGSHRTWWREPVDAESSHDPALEVLLPGGWDDGQTSGWTLGRALSRKRGEPMPWGLLREGIDNAVVSRWLEVTEGSASVGAEHAGALKLRRPEDAPEPEPSPEPRVAQALLEADALQDLAERLPELLSVGAGWGLKFRVGVVLGEDAPDEAREALDEVLKQVSENMKVE